MKNKPEEQILTAVQQLMKTKKADQISVREIASTADVNQAAINYYFGSKEQLIERVVDIYHRELLAIFEQLESENPPDIKTIQTFCNAFLNFLKEHRGTFNTVRDMQNNEKVPKEQTGAQAKLQFPILENVVRKLFPLATAAEAFTRSMELYSSLVYPVMYYDLFDQINDTALSHREIESAYITRIVRTFMKKTD